MEPVTLRTERLVLTPPMARDSEAVFQHCQDPEIQRYTTVPVPYTRESAEYFVTEYVPGGWRDGTEYVLGIRPVGSSELLGVISWQKPRDAIGYWMGAEHRGKGYMTEAVRAVADWMLSPEHGVDAVRWEAYAGNLGSAAVARAAGFRWVGEAPCAVADRDGTHPWGWHALLVAGNRGTVEPLDRWPVLT